MEFGSKQVDLASILGIISQVNYRVLGRMERQVTQPAPIHEVNREGAIAFCSAGRPGALQRIRSTRAEIVICPNDLVYEEADWEEKTLILVEDPRLVFARVMRALFSEKPSYGIHPTAVIHPEALVHPKAYVGPFTCIGKCEIGEGTIILGHVHIYSSNVKIGRRVIIHPGTVIGVDGFGYARNDKGELEYFPSIGGVIIEDDVEIHSNVNVDRGTLGNTIIRQGTKIDKFCHIGHNVTIGKHCVITAHAMIGGSTRIGDYVYIAPCACLRDGIEIGSKAMIGLGALVTKSVPDGSTVMGFPARPAHEYKRILQALKRLAEEVPVSKW